MAPSALLKSFIISALFFALVAAQSATPKRGQQQQSKRPPGSSNSRQPERPAEVEDESDEDETSEECPEPNGYFADAEQCDKYYACSDGKINERLCPDGMVFNDYSPDQEKCDLPFNIDCSKRPNLQTPQPTENCPRLHGYFGHMDPNICDTFYYCVDGKYNMITCPDGLVFNPKTGICTWPDEAQKVGCTSKDIFKFSCPKVNESYALTHPRYADAEDCQFFYVCINGDTPRRNGCKLGQVFGESNKKCEWPRLVPECADWYKDRFTDKQLYDLENPKPKSTRAPANKPPSRRKPQKPTRAQRVPADDADDK